MPTEQPADLQHNQVVDDGNFVRNLQTLMGIYQEVLLNPPLLRRCLDILLHELQLSRSPETYTEEESKPVLLSHYREKCIGLLHKQMKQRQQQSSKVKFTVKAVNGIDSTIELSEKNVENIVLNHVFADYHKGQRHDCLIDDVITNIFKVSGPYFVPMEYQSDPASLNIQINNIIKDDKIKHAQDGCIDNGGHPCYKIEQTVDNKIIAVTSGKPDIISVLGLTMIDYQSRLNTSKSNHTSADQQSNDAMQMFYQALERVMLYARVNNTVKRIANFVTTTSYSWMILFQRERNDDKQYKQLPSSLQLEETLFIVNIAHEDVIPLYDWMNYQSSIDPLFHFFGDWYIVRNLLTSCGITDPTLCGILDYDDDDDDHDNDGSATQSSHRYYKILLPRYQSAIDNATNLTWVNIDPDCNNKVDEFEFVVKINGEASRGHKEVETINHIADCYQRAPSLSPSLLGCSPVRYVIATLSSRVHDGKVKTLYSNDDINILMMFHRSGGCCSIEGKHEEKAIEMKNFVLPNDERVGVKRIETAIATANKKGSYPESFAPSAVRAISKGQGWWQRSCACLHGDNKLNGILMIRGYPHRPIESLLSLLQKLEYINRDAGILHTNLRPGNLMEFPHIPLIIPVNATPFITGFDFAERIPLSKTSIELRLDKGERSEFIRDAFQELSEDDETFTWTDRQDQYCLRHAFRMQTWNKSTYFSFDS